MNSYTLKTHISFIVTGLKDELLRVMLPVLHRCGWGGLVRWTQRYWLTPFTSLKRQPITCLETDTIKQGSKIWLETKTLWSGQYFNILQQLCWQKSDLIVLKYSNGLYLHIWLFLFARKLVKECKDTEEDNKHLQNTEEPNAGLI